MRIISKRNFLYLLIGVIFMSNIYGCNSAFRFKKYSSKDPRINLTIDYIPGWQYREDRGSYDSYAQVIFYEPQKKGKLLLAGMIVTVQPSVKININPATLEAFAEDLVAKILKFKDSKSLSKSNIQFLGAEAINMEFDYKIPDKLNSIDAKLVPIKERVIVFKREDNFYTMRYRNITAEFDKFSRAFDHIVKSIKFKK